MASKESICKETTANTQTKSSVSDQQGKDESGTKEDSPGDTAHQAEAPVSLESEESVDEEEAPLGELFMDFGKSASIMESPVIEEESAAPGPSSEHQGLLQERPSQLIGLSPVVSITQHESLTPVNSSQVLSASSSTRLDWTMTLTPKQRSCINLVHVEPCVSKAMGNLESLLDIIISRLDEADLRPTSRFHSITAPSPVRPVSFRLSAVGREKRDSELSVEGVPTGTTVERLRKHALAKKVSTDSIGGVAMGVVKDFCLLEGSSTLF